MKKFVGFTPIQINNSRTMNDNIHNENLSAQVDFQVEADNEDPLSQEKVRMKNGERGKIREERDRLMSGGRYKTGEERDRLMSEERDKTREEEDRTKNTDFREERHWKRNEKIGEQQKNYNLRTRQQRTEVKEYLPTLPTRQNRRRYQHKKDRIPITFVEDPKQCRTNEAITTNYIPASWPRQQQYEKYYNEPVYQYKEPDTPQIWLNQHRLAMLQQLFPLWFTPHGYF